MVLLIKVHSDIFHSDSLKHFIYSKRSSIFAPAIYKVPVNPMFPRISINIVMTNWKTLKIIGNRGIFFQYMSLFLRARKQFLKDCTSYGRSVHHFILLEIYILLFFVSFVSKTAKMQNGSFNPFCPIHLPILTL